MLNPELKPGDRVILLYMKDESIPPGTKGVVKNKFHIFGIDQYGVKWDDGRTLALLSDVDAWTLEKKKIEEQTDPLMRNVDLLNNFRTNFLFGYLKKLRESSVVNMFGAAPYLYMGKERMERLHYYDDNREEFSEVLEMADEAQQAMVQGVINVIENEGKDADMSTINRYLKKYSQKMLDLYIYRYSLQ